LKEAEPVKKRRRFPLFTLLMCLGSVPFLLNGGGADSIAQGVSGTAQMQTQTVKFDQGDVQTLQNEMVQNGNAKVIIEYNGHRIEREITPELLNNI
jgi:hypothetical protein